MKLEAKSLKCPIPVATTYKLRILATSDLHAHILPHDYAADRPLLTAGLSRTAQLIRKARQEVENSITLDNGDFLQGSLLGDHQICASPADAPTQNPVVQAMNAVGYDAVALGNHDFSFGIPFLQQALSGADFPVVCANVVTRLGKTPVEDQPFCPPTLLLDRHLSCGTSPPMPVRIGILGLLPPQIEQWEEAVFANRLHTRDILETASAWVQNLKSRSADIIIALCHSGIGGHLAQDRMENAAIPLARIPGIDAIIAGHTHVAFPGPGISSCPDVDANAGTICGKPAVMPGFWGSHLGIIDLDLTCSAAGPVVTKARAFNRTIADRSDTGKLVALVDDDPLVLAAAANAHASVRQMIDRPFAHSDVPLHSYFARLTDSAALSLIHAAQLDWLASQTQGSADAALPHLSAASPFKSGDRGGPDNFTDVPAGDLAPRHLADLYCFPNVIRALRIDGATLLNWLERAASQFHQLQPGICDQPLLRPDVPSYNFDTVAGIEYEIDLSQPARFGPAGQLLQPQATRIKNLRCQGRPVVAHDQFVIATNNFRSSGGGNFAGVLSSPVVAAPKTRIVDLLHGYIRTRERLSPLPTNNWRLAYLPPGTGAWFLTSPRARRHIAATAPTRIEPLGETSEGFLRCTLYL